MKKIMLTLVSTLILFTFCQAQKIEKQKAFGGYKYTQNSQQMNMKQLVKTMESNQQAYELIKKAQSNNTLASVIGFVGGGLVGWPLGAALGGGDPNWTLAGIGAGLIVIGIPISSNVNKQATQAVELYNASLDSTSFYKDKPAFNLNITGNGIGFSMSF